jgi:hypothetical protein
MALRPDQGAAVPGSWRGAPGATAGNATQAMGVRGGGLWTPTVGNLLVLVALEIGAYAGLRYFFRRAHGG